MGWLLLWKITVRDGIDMSLTLIEVDGSLYHAQEFYDEEGENVVDTIPILDEDGEMALPAFVYVMLMSRANVVVHVHLGEIIGTMINMFKICVDTTYRIVYDSLHQQRTRRNKMTATQTNGKVVNMWQGKNNTYWALVQYRDWETDRKSTRLNSSHSGETRMPSSA